MCGTQNALEFYGICMPHNYIRNLGPGALEEVLAYLVVIVLRFYMYAEGWIWAKKCCIFCVELTEALVLKSADLLDNDIQQAQS